MAILRSLFLAALVTAGVTAAHDDPAKDTWDYIVVGSGPGGATAARVLALGGHEVLVIEAGEDRDTDDPIMNSAYASTVANDFFPQYSWEAAQLANPRSSGDDQLTGGRLMGGSSSINGEQWVRPSRAWLQQFFLAAGQDPDWKPSQVYSLLTKIERFFGPEDLTYRGTDGPVPVRSSPAEGQLSEGAGVFVQAVVRGLNVPEIIDYNSPDSPIGPFARYQLSQYPNGRRGSSSVAMLTSNIRKLPNLYIKTRTTAVRVLWGGKVIDDYKASGVYVIEAGEGRSLYARQGVILSAGHHSSLLLENSGVGNKEIIEPLLDAVGLPFVVDLPGVGENLGNDGVVFATFEPMDPDPSPTIYDLYSGGAFLGPPTGSAPTTGSARFSQWFGMDPVVTNDTMAMEGMSMNMNRQLHEKLLANSAAGREKMLERRRRLHGDDGGHSSTSNETMPVYMLGMILLNATSRGFAHIQSADPLYKPLATTRILVDDGDVDRWVALMQKQLLPIAMKMEEKGYMLTSPDMTLLESTRRSRRRLHSSGGATSSFEEGTIEAFVGDNYEHSHHWFGTCRIGPRAKYGVVDSNGAVHGTVNLYVADASIIPIKPDGNTQVPAYIMGAMVAKKILSTTNRRR